MTGICILGASGLVGKSVVEHVKKNQALKLVLEITHDNAPAIIQDLQNGIQALEGVNLVIDFSTVEALGDFMPYFAEMAIPIVTGTTGFSDTQFDNTVAAYAKLTSIFHSPNMSPMIGVIKGVISQLNGYDYGILDIHREGKRDTPSGTAKTLNVHQSSNIASFRVADTYGEHIVFISDEYESLEIRHRVITRDVFAKNAIEIGLWLVKQTKGLYCMDDFTSKT